MNLLFLALLSVFLYSFYIRIFKKASQYEREEGLESHKAKTGTITMGGIIFAIVPSLFFIYDSKVFSIMIIIMLYAILGFVDDLLIIIKKNNNGINPNLKFLFQVLIAGLSFFLYLNLELPTIIRLGSLKIEAEWVYGLFMLLMLSASTNAFNITDGVDGLCAGMSMLLSGAFIYIAFQKAEYTIMYMHICQIIVLFIFWCFNYPKAFLFMGDTGSLYLGALYSLTALYLNSVLGFIIMAFLFIFETLSVIIQVTYYKKTKGKRIFKMAPFHHHLEASGYSEIRVDLLFYILEIILIFIVIYFQIY
ncbi:MAG: phospho-N-acetylmuramoyl-pentapeptide-transferase [Acholeplasmatales bacterium]|nr:phospho-N-acetylmuramoyl-pentapeptide-transferase [Acholeplasmatales bacterium]